MIRVTWNGNIVTQTAQPKITFDDKTVDYIAGAFLQPTVESEHAMREFVVRNVEPDAHVADLFCGLGNFTFATSADGFDVVGIGAKRDLFKNPLTIKMLDAYDVVIMDPPRAGALAQTKIIAESNVKKVIYVSCNPVTLKSLELSIIPLIRLIAGFCSPIGKNPVFVYKIMLLITK